MYLSNYFQSKPFILINFLKKYLIYYVKSLPILYFVISIANIYSVVRLLAIALLARFAY